MEVCAEETFGPVISLYPTDSDHEAVQLANRGSYGLSASIWSRDVRTARRLAGQIRAGSVNINDGPPRPRARSRPRWAAWATAAWAGATARRASGATPRPRPSPSSGCCRSGPPPALGVDRFVALTNAQLRLLRRLRVAVNTV